MHRYTEVFAEDEQARADLDAREEGTGQTPLMAASLAGKVGWHFSSFFWQ